jgi:hypothetical protein
MPLTNAERQRTRRERHRGEPRGNKPLLAQLAALQARVAQLEVELSARPRQALRKAPRQAPDAVAALRRERDDGAVEQVGTRKRRFSRHRSRRRLVHVLV